MNVYITYFRYDRDEQYSIYHIDFTKRSSINHFKTKDLPSFLGYGPDDVSYLVLKEVDLSKIELTRLIELYSNSKDNDRELIDFMTDIHDRNGEEIYFTSGDEVWEVLEYFRTSGNYDLDTLLGTDTSTLDEDELKEQCQELVFNDDKLWDKVLKDYIKTYY
jgi:hypothetical protein